MHQEIAEHVVEFSTDQYGSRFIQSKIEVASTEEKQALFDEIVPEHTHRLMQDVFGNYVSGLCWCVCLITDWRIQVIQKFFDHGSEEQVKALGAAVEERALVLAKHIYGCRVVQKVLWPRFDLEVMTSHRLEGYRLYFCGPASGDSQRPPSTHPRMHRGLSCKSCKCDAARVD